MNRARDLANVVLLISTLVGCDQAPRSRADLSEADGAVPPAADPPPSDVPPAVPPAPAEPVGVPAPLRGSYVLTARLRPYGFTIALPASVPRQHQFTVTLEPDGGRATASALGSVTDVAASVAGDELVLEPYSIVASLIQWHDCGSEHVSYEETRLRGFDTDGDGLADRVTGEATGSVSWFDDHNGFDQVRAEIDGVADQQPPSIALRGLSEWRSPVGRLWVDTSESVPLDTTAALRSSRGRLVPLVQQWEFPSGLSRTTVASFVLPDDAVLEWGERYSVELTPGLRDLAGNEASGPLATFETMEAPAPFVPDGFESGVGVRLEGDAHILRTGESGVGPISGNASLYVGTGGDGVLPGRAILRIPAESSAQVLRARYRLLTDDPGLNITLHGSIVVGIPTSRWRQVLPAAARRSDYAPPSDERYRYASDVAELEAVIEPTLAHGAEVVVDIDAAFDGSPCYDAPTGRAIVLDDVRLE